MRPWLLPILLLAAFRPVSQAEDPTLSILSSIKLEAPILSITEQAPPYAEPDPWAIPDNIGVWRTNLLRLETHLKDIPDTPLLHALSSPSTQDALLQTTLTEYLALRWTRNEDWESFATLIAQSYPEKVGACLTEYLLVATGHRDQLALLIHVLEAPPSSTSPENRAAIRQALQRAFGDNLRHPAEFKAALTAAQNLDLNPYYHYPLTPGSIRQDTVGYGAFEYWLQTYGGYAPPRLFGHFNGFEERHTLPAEAAPSLETWSTQDWQTIPIPMLTRTF